MKNAIEVATLGGGCFWCIEAVFLRVKGVLSVQSGFSGGNIKNPAYREVCEGRTGHAEVCEIKFDASIISYKELLDIFWEIHDPTTLNRQGHDVGTHYRSVVFYHNKEQQSIADNLKAELTQSVFTNEPIVTEITAFTNFYPAEAYHNN
jgi:peptide-methionine (S)-S-oxide reductase